MVPRLRTDGVASVTADALPVRQRHGQQVERKVVLVERHVRVLGRPLDERAHHGRPRRVRSVNDPRVGVPALSHEVKARRGPGVLSEGDSDLSQHVDLGGALAAHDLHGLAVVEEAARAHGVLDVARHGVPRVTGATSIDGAAARARIGHDRSDPTLGVLGGSLGRLCLGHNGGSQSSLRCLQRTSHSSHAAPQHEDVALLDHLEGRGVAAAMARRGRARLILPRHGPPRRLDLARVALRFRFRRRTRFSSRRGGLPIGAHGRHDDRRRCPPPPAGSIAAAYAHKHLNALPSLSLSLAAPVFNPPSVVLLRWKKKKKKKKK
mmetsp:Transcript_393/g.1457  ORF Transcript_393/g.1457 Transcript_393/m.1457 type:complete len:321 (-) Transcript_393:22-984(-)